MKNRKRQQKGITLIALVITIIVLLILAGVSIIVLTGDNGILTRASEADIETRAATVEERKNLWKTEKQIHNYTGENTTQTLEEFRRFRARRFNNRRRRIQIEETGYVIIGSEYISFQMD